MQVAARFGSADDCTWKQRRMALSDKQQAFINEYLQCWNASEAARRAGYNGKSNVVGPRLLANVSIKAAIRERLDALTMSADEVLVRLTEIARGNMAHFINPHSLTVDLVEAQKNGKLHLIKKVKYVTRTDNDSQTETIEFELYDAQSALVQLGKMHGLFTGRIKVDDWRSEAIEYIRRGEISYDALAQEFDHDLATELFEAAGVSISTRQSAESARKDA